MKGIKVACFKKSQHLFRCSEKSKEKEKEKGIFWQTFQLVVSEYETEILTLLRYIVGRGIGNSRFPFY